MNLSPVRRSIKGERLLVVSILRQAVDDVLAFPEADISPNAKYRKDSAAYWSVNARRFLSVNDPDFCFYCSILGWDPDYAERVIMRKIRQELIQQSLRRKYRERSCSALNASILNHMWSKLLTMMLATRLFAGGNACVAG